MHKIRIKSETSDQNMNDDEHIHRAMCVRSVRACVCMCVLMLGIGEAIIIISIIQCVHVIENTLAVGTIAFLLDWHRLFRLDRELQKNDIFVREKDTNGIPCNMFPHRQKDDVQRRKKNRQQHNKLKTKQSNRINVTQNIYVASFLLN